MRTGDTELPAFNLKVVIRETGLRADTIRAWERRYGLPNPERTAGGHRLYSQRDIDMLKWLIARQHEGLSISRAVDLWQSLEGEGRNPLTELTHPSGSGDAALASSDSGMVDELRRAWVLHCLAFDEQRAEAVITDALSRLPPETVALEILQKGLAGIGDLWYEGEATVQQEHFASAIAMRRLEMLVGAAPPPTRSGRILVACAPDENHTFGPLLIALLLKRQGWDVLYLGGSVPVEQLEQTMATTHPRLVILAAQQLRTAATLLETAALLQRLEIPLGFGGRIFERLPTLTEYIPGYYLGGAIEDVPSQIENLLHHMPALPQVKSCSAEHIEVLRAFQESQPAIQAAVWERLESNPNLREYLDRANFSLTRAIIAALTICDIQLLSEDIDWVHDMLARRDIPVDLLRDHLATYSAVTAEVMGSQAEPITGWLGYVTNHM